MTVGEYAPVGGEGRSSDASCKVDLPTASPVPASDEEDTPRCASVIHFNRPCGGCAQPSCPQRASYKLKEKEVAVWKSIGCTFLVFVCAGFWIYGLHVALGIGVDCAVAWVGWPVMFAASVMILVHFVKHDDGVWTTDCDIAVGVFLRVMFAAAFVLSMVLLGYAMNSFDVASRDVHSAGV